jgi:hypothetical protein
MDLQGKVIVITGAAQGLGQKMAEVIADHGAKLALVDSITQNSRRRYGSARKRAVSSVHLIRCPHARAQDERRFQRAVTQTDLREPPGRCSGCWPHDGEVAGGAVAISFLADCCSQIPVRGDDGARAVGATDNDDRC